MKKILALVTSFMLSVSSASALQTASPFAAEAQVWIGFLL